MFDAEPPFEQRLRAAGAEQRDLHRGGDDPPGIEAVDEGSMKLANTFLARVFTSVPTPVIVEV
jgi:hypothetical protein